MQKAKPPSTSFNALYFGTFFLALLLFSLSGLIHKSLFSGPQAFFMLYAAGQAALEVLLLIAMTWIMQHFGGRIALACFIAFTFAAFLLHIMDFIMDRILDRSALETLFLFLTETSTNFTYLLEASGIAPWIWKLLFLLLGSLPFFGFLIYRALERFSLSLSVHSLAQALVCIPIALFLWDLSASRTIHPDTYTAFAQSLPWKRTFLEPKTISLPLKAPLKKPQKEEDLQRQIAEQAPLSQPLPNIYLFIVESLREDFITPEVAPHLFDFKEKNTHFPKASSNANGSHPAWFAILHSQFPHVWKYLQEKHDPLGSPALALLKKWGYQIHVLSSAQLRYYGMEELLFGKDCHLLHSYQQFPHLPPKEAWRSDQESLEALLDKLQDPALQQGQLFIVFWDSTHFDYSWPKSTPAPFTPFCSDMTYFKIFQSSATVETIKNRYRNSIHYIDSLFGRFLSSLPKKEDALVVFTGDHGEEFFERGHLFHGSHLVREQTHIPLYFKFGSKRSPPPSAELASQMDIFPTLIDYLSGTSVHFLEGSSLFDPGRWPYVFISRFQGGKPPYEFCLQNHRYKLIARFSDQKNLFETSSIQIRSLRKVNDESLLKDPREILQWAEEEFSPALDALLSPQSSFH